MGEDDDTNPDAVGERVSGDEETATSLLGHYYRGELNRMNTEQNRIDRTTNWAITLIAAILALVFSTGDQPHYVLLVGILVLGMLHVVETRRYRAYDTWRSRVRLVEEDLIAPTLDPGGGVEHADWRAELAADLREPAHKIPFVEAYARRLRRVYFPLFLVLFATWIARILLASEGQGPLSGAAVFGVPGWLVVATATAFAVALFAVAFWPRERRAKGELRDHERRDHWKDE